MVVLTGIAALFLAAQVIATDSAVTSLFGGEEIACSKLKHRYPHTTFLPDTPDYAYETQTPYWSATTYSTPACVFVAQDAKQVSFAVSTMTLTRSKFAVRGGGHMPIPGYNGIESSGVLLSSSNLTAISLSSDKSTVSVGPGNRWRDVYGYLKPSNLTAVGGRVGHVGVPGLLLGGGVSFHSSQYGFASDNVVKYECVLSSGEAIEATATNTYSDLFWALKGGGNSFCIVTRFDLKTIPSSNVWVGVAQYNQSQATGYLDALYNFGRYGASADPKAAIIPTILTVPSLNLTTYVAAKFYDSQIDSLTAFENFTAPRLTPAVDSYALQPLADYVAAMDVLQPLGLRQEFRTLSSVVQRDAVQLVHDTFMSGVHSKLSHVANLQASVTFQPVTKDFLSHGIKAGGNPQGVDISKAPFFSMDENFTWTEASDDVVVHTAADQVTADINRLLQEKSLDAQYLYMNDAGKGQPVFQSYPAANLQRLKAIRTKYDPLKVYTNLMPGGWKVADA